MRITLREVLFSVSIIAVFFCSGVLISGGITKKHQKEIQEFRSRVQVETVDEFSYCIRTEVGGFISEGVLYCSDPVSISDIPGSFMEIRRVKEKYTMHTRVITTTDSEGHTHTKTENYWTWDVIERNFWEAKVLMFLDQRVYVKIPEPKYLETIQETSHTRYKYYVTPKRVSGVITGNLENQKIEREKFIPGMTIERATKEAESNAGKIVFWVLWIVFCCGCVVLFYYFENTWLED